MGRPPLPVGTFGAIRSYQRGKSWVARANFRDFDGVTRPVERTGRSKAAAERELKTELRNRAAAGGTSLSGDSKFGDVAEAWFARVAERIEDGRLQEGTGETYRRQLDRHVLPGLAALRLREVTTPRVDAFLQSVKVNTGAPTARTCRSVVSGIMGLAVRQGAVTANPVRDADTLPQRSRTPRALTVEECATWVGLLWADPVAVEKDLPALTTFMLGTGVRIGEALAVSWQGVDLAAATVEIGWKLVRITGKGLLRIPRTKSDAGERLLSLPPFVADMLARRRRLAELDGAWQADGPVFPHSLGGWRDPRNTRRDLRNARGSGDFAWVTSHVFRKTCATILDDAGRSARAIADQLGHARPSMTQDVYMGRKVVTSANAHALEAAFAMGSTERRG